MQRLGPVVFHDDWGSTIHLASLQGRPIPSARPESELWMGAHESGPGVLLDDPDHRTLDEFIAADPFSALGQEVAEAFDRRLPFLLKVLAPGRALSIQAHPSREQAHELRAAAAPEDRDTVYVDDWGKPELLVAISPFEVFVGMRTFAEAAELIAAIDQPLLRSLVEQAARDQRPEHRLLELILAVPREEVAQVVREVVAACVRMEATDNEFGQACAALVRVAEDHADDIGLVVLLLMHHRRLRAGEYIDVPAGVLHSYVSGLGIEVLANSDNVVRAGLTTKALNVPELLRIVDPQAQGLGGISAVAGRAENFPSTADHFALTRVRAPRGVTLPGTGRPRLVFCLRGSVRLRCGDRELELGPAESAFVSAVDPAVYATGSGEVYAVTVGAAYQLPEEPPPAPILWDEP